MASGLDEAKEPARTAIDRAREEDGDEGVEAGVGYYFYGALRSGSWRRINIVTPELDELLRIRYRDLEALVRTVPFTLPVLDDDRLKEHQRVIEASMRRGSILPAPYGVVFRGRRPLLRFLQDQYIVLDEGIAFLEGHWELRLHLSATDQEPDPELGELATHVYSELRRLARAALPFPRYEGRLFGAAFLVERDSWIRFVEKADDLISAHPELAFDITGPWPPYDFVRIVT